MRPTATGGPRPAKAAASTSWEVLKALADRLDDPPHGALVNPEPVGNLLVGQFEAAETDHLFLQGTPPPKDLREPVSGLGVLAWRGSWPGKSRETSQLPRRTRSGSSRSMSYFRVVRRRYSWVTLLRAIPPR
jgi:hypothetical protein